MSDSSWVIPVATLGAICVVALAFVWWWFPRTWRKGTKQEIEIRHAETAMQPEEDRTWQKQIIARALAQERGEDVSGWVVNPPARVYEHGAPPPPAYTTNPV